MTPDNFYFQYTIDPDSDEPIMLINKHIGFDKEDGYGIMGDVFQRELLQLDTMGKKRIQIWINSPGGLVTEGYNICTAILNSVTKVDTYCTFMAASIAGVIFQTGRNRIMADYGFLMYHDPYDTEDDNAKDPLLLTVRQSIVALIASKSGMTEDAVSKMMAKTSYITADEALAKGLCDKIQESAELNKKRPVPGSSMKAYWKGSQHLFNSIIDNTKKNKVMSFPKLANKLNLNPEATEDSYVVEIDKLLNKVSKAEKDCKDKEDELDKHKGEMDKKKDEYDSMKSEHDKIKKELDDLKKKVSDDAETDKVKNQAKLETEAKNMIDGFVLAGRLKNEAKVKEKWVNLAKADMEGTKEMIEALPIIKKASTLSTLVNKESGTGQVGSVIGRTMANKLAGCTKD